MKKFGTEPNSAVDSIIICKNKCFINFIFYRSAFAWICFCSSVIASNSSRLLFWQVIFSHRLFTTNMHSDLYIVQCVYIVVYVKIIKENRRKRWHTKRWTNGIHYPPFICVWWLLLFCLQTQNLLISNDNWNCLAFRCRLFEFEVLNIFKLGFSIILSNQFH